jgi:cell division protein FtsQ
VFGTTGDLRSKWTAAVSVLSDPEVAGASYIDLRVPSRPAVGGLPAEPGTGEIDPVTGMPAAQAETQATDPSTGETIDPATGAAVDPATGQAIDPTTGQAIDPATGAPVDPAAAGSSGPSGPYGAG